MDFVQKKIYRSAKIFFLFTLLMVVNIVVGQQVLLDFDYISKHVSQLELEEPDFYNLFNSKRQNKVFLLGETHGIASNPKIQLSLIDYLSKYKQLSVVWLEMPMSSQYWLDQFFEQGDTNLLLELLYDEEHRSIFSTTEYFDFFISLYALNTSKAKEQQIRFLAIDKEHDLDIAMKRMQFFLDQNDSLKGVERAFSNVRRRIGRKESIKASLATLIKLDKGLTHEIKKIKAYKQYRRILYNCFYGLKIGREKLIYKNSLFQTHRYQNRGSVFAQMGAFHVINKKRFLVKKYFAERLNYTSKSPYKNQVCTAMMVYKNCAMYNMPARYTQGLLREELFDKVLDHSPYTFSIIDIQGEGSLFTKEQELYYGLILVKDQEKLNRLKPGMY